MRKFILFSFIILLANVATAQENDTTANQLIDENKISETDSTATEPQPQPRFTEYYGDGVYSYENVAYKPRFQGVSAADFDDWISWNVEYTDEMRQNSIQGTIIVSFIISPYGEVTNVVLEQSLIPALDNQIVNAIYNSPQWSPGRDRAGNPVSVKMYAIDSIKLSAKQNYESVNASELTDDFADYETISLKPKFNDGDIRDFVQWLKDNVTYPKRSIKRGVFGDIRVEFIIDIHGNIRNLRLVEGVEKNTDKAFLQALLKSPQWAPGRNALGRIVPTKVQLSFAVDAIIKSKEEDKNDKKEDKKDEKASDKEDKEKAKEEEREAKEQAKFEKELEKQNAKDQKENAAEQAEMEKEQQKENAELEKLQKELEKQE